MVNGCVRSAISMFTMRKQVTLKQVRPEQKVPDFPDSWRCPVCGATTEKLVPVTERNNGRKPGQGLMYLANFSALSRYRLKKRLISKHADPVIETTFLGTKVNCNDNDFLQYPGRYYRRNSCKGDLEIREEIALILFQEPIRIMLFCPSRIKCAVNNTFQWLTVIKG